MSTVETKDIQECRDKRSEVRRRSSSVLSICLMVIFVCLGVVSLIDEKLDGVPTRLRRGWIPAERSTLGSQGVDESVGVCRGTGTQ